MLNDISLSLFVGLAAGAYSSIFIATPLVADLKGREQSMKVLRRRVLARRASAAAQGEPLPGASGSTAAGAGDAEYAEDTDAGDPEGAAPAVVGQRGGRGAGTGRRSQPSSRNRGRGRPSGKRR
jgi:preprotein translocase subunit SecF